MPIGTTDTQLAIRFTEQQIKTLDALAAESDTSRSAVVKALVLARWPEVCSAISAAINC